MNKALFNIDTALVTPRLVVRRFREGDGAAFHALIQENTAYIEDHFPMLIDRIRDDFEGEVYVRELLAEWLLQQSFAFGVWHNTETKLIGYVHYKDIDWFTPRADISYFVHEQYAKRGFMTEAVARVLEFGFRQLQLNKIGLRVLMDNYASQRLARKLGFRREGDLRHEYRKNSGILHDLMLLGLTREEAGL